MGARGRPGSLSWGGDCARRQRRRQLCFGEPITCNLPPVDVDDGDRELVFREIGGAVEDVADFQVQRFAAGAHLLDDGFGIVTETAAWFGVEGDASHPRGPKCFDRNAELRSAANWGSAVWV